MVCVSVCECTRDIYICVCVCVCVGVCVGVHARVHMHVIWLRSYTRLIMSANQRTPLSESCLTNPSSTTDCIFGHSQTYGHLSVGLPPGTFQRDSLALSNRGPSGERKEIVISALSFESKRGIQYSALLARLRSLGTDQPNVISCLKFRTQAVKVGNTLSDSKLGNCRVPHESLLSQSCKTSRENEEKLSYLSQRTAMPGSSSN